MQKSIDLFNQANPIGKEIRYTNEKGEEKTGEIRFPAEILDGGKAAVWIAKRCDAVPLDKLIQ